MLVLNATPEPGLATQMKDVVVAAGWAEDTVLASEAGSTDFPETTIYYYLPTDEAAAAGLAEVIGGAKLEQSDVYQPADDPEAKQLADRDRPRSHLDAADGDAHSLTHRGPCVSSR